VAITPRLPASRKPFAVDNTPLPLRRCPTALEHVDSTVSRARSRVPSEVGQRQALGAREPNSRARWVPSIDVGVRRHVEEVGVGEDAQDVHARRGRSDEQIDARGVAELVARERRDSERLALRARERRERRRPWIADQHDPRKGRRRLRVRRSDARAPRRHEIDLQRSHRERQVLDPRVRRWIPSQQCIERQHRERFARAQHETRD
jgi:hypothetical protein